MSKFNTVIASRVAVCVCVCVCVQLVVVVVAVVVEQDRLLRRVHNGQAGDPVQSLHAVAGGEKYGLSAVLRGGVGLRHALDGLCSQHAPRALGRGGVAATVAAVCADCVLAACWLCAGLLAMVVAFSPRVGCGRERERRPWDMRRERVGVATMAMPVQGLFVPVQRLCRPPQPLLLLLLYVLIVC